MIAVTEKAADQRFGRQVLLLERDGEQKDRSETERERNSPEGRKQKAEGSGARLCAAFRCLPAAFFYRKNQQKQKIQSNDRREEDGGLNVREQQPRIRQRRDRNVARASRFGKFVECPEDERREDVRHQFGLRGAYVRVDEVIGQVNIRDGGDQRGVLAEHARREEVHRERGK